MTDRSKAELQTYYFRARILTNVAMPILAFIPIFLGVLLVGVFALLLHPDRSVQGAGGALVPWICALVGSLGIFTGCNFVFMWQRERERLRRRSEGEG